MTVTVDDMCILLYSKDHLGIEKGSLTYCKLPVQLHFVHERSSDPNAIPLIFSHGWPGSFIEAFKMIRKLKDPGTGPPAAP